MPELSHFKMFGTTVYPFLKPFNENKLWPRSAQCLFLGYSVRYKGAICYNMQTGKLILSRHVIHNESVFPCKKLPIHVEDDVLVLQKSRHVPILVQLPVSNVNGSVSISDSGSSQESQLVSVP